MEDKKVVFVPHCILNQNVRAVGKKSNGTIKEIIKFFAESEIGIIQLPCPEVEFDGGLERQFKTKENYNNEVYRKCCREISLKILKEVRKYLDKEYKVIGILGVEFSPTCAVHRIENGKRILPGKGILMEELEKEMQNENFQVPIIAVNLNNIFSSLEKLSLLLKNS